MTLSFILEKLKYDMSPLADLSQLVKGGGTHSLTVNEARIGPGDGVVVQPGGSLWLSWSGRVFCTCCGNQTPKLFGGYCWNCFNAKASADSCVMAPQKCHYLSGTCREPLWGKGFCYQPHVVYLSYTGGFKVGITRATQVPVRWIDQGATFAIVLACVGSRHQAGVIETTLAQHFSDKTAWARMLAAGNSIPDAEERRSVLAQVTDWQSTLGPLDPLNVRVSAPPSSPGAGQILWSLDAAQVEISFAKAVPIAAPKTQVMEKGGRVGGTVTGFKGQYILFEDGVFNVRRHEGYEIKLDAL
jgi:hypothetical protein